MKHRYIDTDLWKKRWFRQLLPEEKDAWVYLFCTCDNVGVWDVDIEIAEVLIGQKIDWETFIEKVNNGDGDRIKILSEEKWWLPGFCEFQYPGFPNENVKPHQSYIRNLKRQGLWSRWEGQGKPKPKARRKVGPSQGEGLDLKGMAIEVMTYLNEKTHQNFQADALGHRDWLAPRFKEGKTVEQMKQIVDIKAKMWLKDEKMSNYLTPQTLFKKKTFDSYLGEYASQGSRKEASIPGWDCPKCGQKVTNTGSFCGNCNEFTRKI
jgi:uncharacterized phage protein (TIGR02220 family)